MGWLKVKMYSHVPGDTDFSGLDRAKRQFSSATVSALHRDTHGIFICAHSPLIGDLQQSPVPMSRRWSIPPINFFKPASESSAPSKTNRGLIHRIRACLGIALIGGFPSI